MNCLINNIIKGSIQKGTNIEVVRRYIRIKYHMNIDLKALDRRLKLMRKDSMNFA
jgi:hypothetical protein